jgi:hypothetical protein
VNSAGQLTGGSVFLSCETNPSTMPGRTVVRYQLNAAPTTPFVSVGPMFFIFEKGGLFGWLQSPITKRVDQRQFGFLPLLSESINITGIVYKSVELRGTAVGVSPSRPTAGGINYRLGDALGTLPEKDRLIAKCD